MDSDQNSNIHFQVFDFKGNLIICEEDQWQDHVLGKRRHLELDGQEELVINALQKPSTGMRYYSSQEHYPNRMAYYGEGGITRYVRVIIEFADEQCTGNGRLVTAFSVNNMKPGERPEWPKK